MSQACERAQQIVLGVPEDKHYCTDDAVVSPFLNWPIDMMEQMFARRPELETYAWRIQGAA